ncbi:YciI family protein [Flavobacteriaceae bacterium M23B6Z8]
MKEFLMIFRAPEMGDYQPSDAEMAETTKQWGEWIGGIAGGGNLVRTDQVGFDAKVVTSKGEVIDKHYDKADEIVYGYMLMKANSSEEASQIASKCPILYINGQVEIRDIMIYD